MSEQSSTDKNYSYAEQPPAEEKVVITPETQAKLDTEPKPEGGRFPTVEELKDHSENAIITFKKETNTMFEKIDLTGLDSEKTNPVKQETQNDLDAIHQKAGSRAEDFKNKIAETTSEDNSQAEITPVEEPQAEEKPTLSEKEQLTAKYNNASQVLALWREQQLAGTTGLPDGGMAEQQRLEKLAKDAFDAAMNFKENPPVEKEETSQEIINKLTPDERAGLIAGKLDKLAESGKNPESAIVEIAGNPDVNKLISEPNISKTKALFRTLLGGVTSFFRGFKEFCHLLATDREAALQYLQNKRSNAKNERGVAQAKEVGKATPEQLKDMESKKNTIAELAEKASHSKLEPTDTVKSIINDPISGALSSNIEQQKKNMEARIKALSDFLNKPAEKVEVAPDVIADDIFNKFVSFPKEQYKVPDDIIDSIARKIKNVEQLSPRELAIQNTYGQEINDVLKKEKDAEDAKNAAPVAPEKKEPTPEELKAEAKARYDASVAKAQEEYDQRTKEIEEQAKVAQQDTNTNA